jgi:2-polyprenyl-6-methoxyphenol hydroxylase-like FAD-dependent oxidoreductase
MITNSASTSHTGLRVLIAGGGIAGLSLARALKDAGHHPLVIEGNTEWPVTGTAQTCRQMPYEH